MKKILLPGIISGLVISITGMLIGMIFNAICPSLALEYQNTAIFRPMQDPLMMIFWLYPFILGIALAWIWDLTKPILTGAKWQNIAKFALAYFVISQVPGMLITYSSFQLSLLIVLSWALNGLVNGFIIAFFASLFNKS
ncbi:hypothetical protein ACFL2K_01980 [Candidatus Margulisiibacteriota bacterium]